MVRFFTILAACNSHALSCADFCLWAPSKPGEEVGAIEGEMIAWCTKPGHGTRLIPEGALTGVQYMKTPDYVQVVGFIDQTKINMLKGDYGGEMDPHGADLVRILFISFQATHLCYTSSVVTPWAVFSTPTPSVDNISR